MATTSENQLEVDTGKLPWRWSIFTSLVSSVVGIAMGEWLYAVLSSRNWHSYEPHFGSWFFCTIVVGFSLCGVPRATCAAQGRDWLSIVMASVLIAALNSGLFCCVLGGQAC